MAGVRLSAALGHLALVAFCASAWPGSVMAQDRFARNDLVVAVLTAPSNPVSLEPRRPGHLETLQALRVVAPGASSWSADILDDETLRAGDVVMFADGPRVFAGEQWAVPHTERDFLSLTEASRLSAHAREELAGLAPSPPVW